MQPLKIFTVPLDKSAFIEASAGTGKTYAMIALMVRCILQKGTPIEKLCALTFTNAGAAELKSRLRKILIELRDLFDGEDNKGGSSSPSSPSEEDEVLTRWLCHYREANAKKRDMLREYLRNALAHYDEVAMGTIHGFVNRVLKTFSFEAHEPLEGRGISDITQWLHMAVEDFWRSYFYTETSKEFASYLVDLSRSKKPHRDKHLLNRDALVRFMQDFFKLRRQVVPTKEAIQAKRDDLYKRLQIKSFLKEKEAFQRQWHERYRGEVKALLEEIAPMKIVDGKRLSHKTEAAREARLREVDAFFEETFDMSLPKLVACLRPTHHQASCNKNKSLPPHAVYDYFENIAEAMQLHVDYYDMECLLFRHKLIEYVEKRLDDFRYKWQWEDFTGLIHGLERKLKSEDTKKALVDSASRQYDVIFIDEFQDTDPTQYELLRQLFAGKPIFLIGDPKQSIYRFRGGDVHTYLEVREKYPPKHVYSMDVNYRSEKSLLDGLNALFAPQNGRSFFGTGIGYRPLTAGAKKISPRKMSSFLKKPIECWYLSSDDLQTSHVSSLRRQCADWIGKYLLEGLDDQKLTVYGAPLQEVAILCTENKEVRLISQRLERYGVPCRVLQDDNVFITDEARALYQLLSAIEAPYKEGLVRGALMDVFIGQKAAVLVPLQGASQALDMWLRRFKTYQDTWHDKGFMAMIRLLERETSFKQKLLDLPEGSKRLSNVLNLIEHVNHLSTKEQLTPSLLIRAFERLLRQEQAMQGDDIEKTTSVKPQVGCRDTLVISTIHKSKGLEYTHVYCPFLWKKFSSNEGYQAGTVPSVQCVADGHRLFDIGSTNYEVHEDRQTQEERDESRRLLYVAMTRAKEKLVFIYHPPQKASMLGDLFEHLGVTSKDDFPLFKEGLEGLSPAIDVIKKPLSTQVQDRSSTLSSSPEKESYSAPLIPPSLPFKRIQTSFDVSSFSSLKSHVVTVKDENADDERLSEASHDEESLLRDAMNMDENTVESPTFLLSRGKRIGLLFHAILERTSLLRRHEALFKAEVEHLFEAYEDDLKEGDQDYLMDILERVLSLPLEDGDTTFCLQDALKENVQTEVEFIYPVRPVSEDSFQALLQKALTYHAAALPAEYGKQLSLGLPIGFFKGYIDMVVRHKQKTYLIDWKTNHLGFCFDDYQHERLHHEMVHTQYYLQGMMYLLGLHLHLKKTMPAYRYAEHVGGIYYIFLRGVHPKKRTGIYLMKPAVSWVEEMERKVYGG